MTDKDIFELEEILMELILQKKVNEGKIVFSGCYSELLN